MNRVFTILVAVILTANAWAQSPQKMSYQAVIRNVSNNLVTNAVVGMQISILQGSSTGIPVYVETQSPTTNANGLVSIEIGNGTVVSGEFSAIDWANGTYFLKTETDPTGGSDYTISGTSELMSVPYALMANESNHAVNADSSVKAQSATNMQLNDLTDVNATPMANDVLKWNGTTWISAPDSLGRLTLPYKDTLDYTGPAFNIHNYGGGPAIRGDGGVEGRASFGGIGISGYANTGTTAVGGLFASESGLALFTGNGNVRLSQYTQLGDNQTAPFIRMKKVTGTTATTQGGTVTFTHGMDAAKIIGVTVLVRGGTNSWVPPSYDTSGFVYNYFFDGAIFYLTNSAGNSALILSKPYSVLFTYEK